MKKNILKIVIIGMLLLGINYFRLNYKSKNVFENKTEKESNLAILVETNFNTYEVSSNNTWPFNYVYNDVLSYCEKGTKLEWNELEETITAKDISKSDKCYIYFSKGESLNIVVSNPANLNANQAGMYRYQGSSEEVDNNYICFGTSDLNACLTNQEKYMYRIIGITEDGLIKVIKNLPLPETYQYATTKDKEVTWSESPLFQGLNGSYFLTNSAYDYLQNPTWLKMIVDYNWLHGAFTSSYGTTYGTKNVEDIYNLENGLTPSRWLEKVDVSLKGQPGISCRNSNQNIEVCYIIHDEAWSSTVKAKIGLMYAYDYYYSVQKEGYNCNYHIARNLNGGVVDPKCANAWLNYPNSAEWIITRIGYWDGGNQYNAWDFLNGVIDNGIITSSNSVRPVFYLNIKRNIKGSGVINGEVNDPYIISI